MKSSPENAPILTVGIPTYNRSEAVCQRLRECLALATELPIEIMILDNHSNDGTFLELRQIQVPSVLASRVKILENNENIGYNGNFFKLITQCQTEYLIVTSDEDEVVKSGLQELLAFLETKQPDFISPQVHIAGELYRGRTKIREIEFHEHEEASFYLSGLCFKVPSAQTFLNILPELSTRNALVEVYPQTALAACLVAMGRGYWLNAAVTTKRNDLPTNIIHSSGNIYYHLPGRYEQFKGSVELNNLLLSHDMIEPQMHSRIRAYNSTLYKSFFLRVRTALRNDDSHLARQFDLGAIRFFVVSLAMNWSRAKLGKVARRIVPMRFLRILKR
jgi:glycosyltransferase involved in cell wall biosynthesis